MYDVSLMLLEIPVTRTAGAKIEYCTSNCLARLKSRDGKQNFVPQEIQETERRPHGRAKCICPNNKLNTLVFCLFTYIFSDLGLNCFKFSFNC